jgi:segregation and condensation protein A
MTELVVDLDGFEGPISLLLVLAREQKLDLRHISILALAEQYLRFIDNADAMRLELAADYLVMAAWLAYLKSRLLLPDPPPDDEPSGAELAAALQFQLQRLEAMQKAGAALLARPLLGREVHEGGIAAPDVPAAPPSYAVSLFDLLSAYGQSRQRGQAVVLRIEAPEYYSVDDALRRLNGMIGVMVEWRSLQLFLPPQWRGSALGRSALAATFAASLELAKSGRVELRQDQAFGPILLRSARKSP